MENCRKRGEKKNIDEEGEKQRHGISTALTVQEVKSSSKHGKSSLVARKRREEEEQPIHWDRFLPTKLLTVLLVENDESTRLIVTALLRKCSYEVSAVADGRKAWEALKERDRKVDLVLTEVVTPCLSGFDLLSKIMNNERCKNIPVVMMASHDSSVMSSHDSLGIVLRCMLKGAADFLTKPVRNNELRNLWQHVWRKYCATLETVSDNVAAINCGISNSRKGFSAGDNSDEEGDSQRSYCDTEVKNGGGLKLKENPESDNENYVQEFDCESTEPECYVFNDKGKAKEKAAGEEINLSLSIRVPDLAPDILKPNGFYKGSPCSTEIRFSSGKEGASLDSEHIDRIGGTNEPSKEIIDFIGATITKQSKCPVMENRDHAEDIIRENERPSVIRRSTLDSGSSQLLGLSLWGPQLRFSDDEVFQEKHALNCSGASDFSRYDGGKIPVSCPISGSSAVSLCMRTGDPDSANCHINSSNCVENHQSHHLKQVMEDQKVNIKSSYPQETVSTSYERVDQIGNCNLRVTDTSGSNGCNDGTSATETGTALDGGNRDGLQNIKGKGLDHRCPRREAALTRFRLKRKDRFFGEKVRYYGRKKLAEQRPRLKGRFVHQAVTKPDDSGMDD